MAPGSSSCRQLRSRLYDNGAGLTSRGVTSRRLSAASQEQSGVPGACDSVLKVTGRKGKKERQTARGAGTGRRRRSWAPLSRISEQLDGFVLTAQEERLKHHHPTTSPQPPFRTICTQAHIHKHCTTPKGMSKQMRVSESKWLMTWS